MASTSSRSILVTGASGYIGSAVARSFVSAGWTVYGLVRRQEAFAELESERVIPILGSPDDLKWLPKLYEHADTFSAIASVTENIADYVPHFTNSVAMLRSISAISNANGVRPLVLFTSGCKDYGRTALDGAPGLEPSTEESPLKPPPFARGRCDNAVRIFENKDLFDAILLRPTTVFGLTSSFYADAFLRASRAQSGSGIIEIPSQPKSIAHGCHVDDCGDAYVALAEHSDRAAVSGQVFNISGQRYETAKEIAEALVKEYGLKRSEYKPNIGSEDVDFTNMLFAFSQWVASEKIRKLTGWSDRRPLFAEGIKQYRQEYELAKGQGNYKVQKVSGRLERLSTK